MGNYLRVHRRRARLTQQELGKLVGYERPWQISRHERSKAIPPFLIALAYQAVFGTPVSEIFLGIHVTVVQVVEKRIAELQADLEAKGGTLSEDQATIQKIQWLTKRNKR